MGLLFFFLFNLQPFKNKTTSAESLLPERGTPNQPYPAIRQICWHMSYTIAEDESTLKIKCFVLSSFSITWFIIVESSDSF